MNTLMLVALPILLGGSDDIANELKQLEGTWIPFAARRMGKP
jgi:hypothetical protein